MKFFVLSLMGFLLSAATLAGELRAAEPDWSVYNALLKKYVYRGRRDGVPLNMVQYGKLKRDPRWREVVRLVETFPTRRLSSRAEKLSFYINAYNILALKMVVDHYPVKSIRDIGTMSYGPFSVWKKTAGKINGREISLDRLEHGVLRPMGEPRIHFAIVCASVSCPDLRREAFQAARLNEQLAEQSRDMLGNSAKGLRVNHRNKTVRVSKILSWFSSDFKGGVENFIRKYRSIPGGYKINADLPYNWKLNGR